MIHKGKIGSLIRYHPAIMLGCRSCPSATGLSSLSLFNYPDGQSCHKKQYSSHKDKADPKVMLTDKMHKRLECQQASLGSLINYNLSVKLPQPPRPTQTQKIEYR